MPKNNWIKIGAHDRERYPSEPSRHGGLGGDASRGMSNFTVHPVVAPVDEISCLPLASDLAAVVREAGFEARQGLGA